MSATEGAVKEAKLSNDYLPAEALERSKVGNKFEKTKCAKAGDTMFTEVRFTRSLMFFLFLCYDMKMERAVSSINTALLAAQRSTTQHSHGFGRLSADRLPTVCTRSGLHTRVQCHFLDRSSLRPWVCFRHMILLSCYHIKNHQELPGSYIILRYSYVESLSEDG